MALNEERDTEATETTAQESVPDAQKADEAKAESSTEPEVQPNPLREADIAKKEALVSELQEFVRTSDWRHGSQQLRPTMDAWRAIHNWHTAKEDELWEAFQTARHTIYAERTHEREASQAAKEKLAEEADKLRDSREWKATAERFHLLMDAWKKAGSAGHEEDDRLWEKFNGAQHEFFERRNAHYQELDSLHAKARAKKQELIERLRALPEPDESWGASQWKAQTNQVHDLMTEWRAAGQAGREENDRLWEEFNGLRQKFFDAQHAHYAAVEAQYKKNAEAKQELIDTAKRVSAAMDFGPEATETMKGLDVKWKAIGYAGPKTNDALWESFHDAKEKFWLQKRAYHEARHEIAQKKSEEAIERREAQIENLQGQIDHLRDKMETTTSQEYLDNMEGWIQEKEERIQDLKAQIEDIRQKLR
ncbi:DUF349 domain-containing protein [Atopobiaceae bacterium HCP3S3_A4]